MKRILKSISLTLFGLSSIALMLVADSAENSNAWYGFLLWIAGYVVAVAAIVLLASHSKNTYLSAFAVCAVIPFLNFLLIPIVCLGLGIYSGVKKDGK